MRSTGRGTDYITAEKGKCVLLVGALTHHHYITAEKGKCVLLVGALTPPSLTLQLKKANAFYW